jgi:hypothetical protein
MALCICDAATAEEHAAMRGLAELAFWGVVRARTGGSRNASPKRYAGLMFPDRGLVPLFPGRRPPQTEGKRRLVILPLDHVLRTTLVEPKDFVVQVKTGDEETQAVTQGHGSLGIHLYV